MTDRELLEKAAKAAGVALDGESPYGGFWLWDEGRMRHDSWNPLTDDGDALRLAVKLGLLIDVRYTDPERIRYNQVTYWPQPSRGEQMQFGDRESDPYAATRRAIVRAAAAIGETK